MALDFRGVTYSLPKEDKVHQFSIPSSSDNTDFFSTATRLHLALPAVQINEATRTIIKDLVSSADALPSQRHQLESLHIHWEELPPSGIASTPVMKFQ